MKPHVICHMGSSIEGRIVPKHWPEALSAKMGEIYEHIHQKLKGEAWIVGRITMAEFGKGDRKPLKADQKYPRTTWKSPNSDRGPVAIDQSGNLHLNINRANNDPIIVVATEAVLDNYLAELRRDGISYLFAGQKDLDIALALEKLNEDFGVTTLLLEGGGGINGSFLDADLIDEISLLLIPVADGHADMPTTFDGVTSPSRMLALSSVDRLHGDFLHLRYTVK
jgi:riboflavin biosynthesis pyrimidine reductase